MPAPVGTAMKKRTGIVFSIQKYSVHDGDGIRTIVFLKGCPLRCSWCSNPESHRFEQELAYNPRNCLGVKSCGWCVTVCPNGAIKDMAGMPALDRGMCTGCLRCAETCPSGALSVYGEQKSVDEVLRRVEEDGQFYARSGGGMTLSGGEAMAQAEFVLELLGKARNRRINTAMETCGHCMWEPLSKVCSQLNSLIFDIKCLSTAKHKKFTGVGNELILQNFKRVCASFPDLPILTRTPVVPGFNDTEQDIREILNFLPRQDNISYELLPYHRMGQPKYEYLGRPFGMEGLVLDKDWFNQLKVMADAWMR